MPSLDTSLLASERWRLNNLYEITVPGGGVVPFRMNYAQRDLYDGMWYNNIICKARQLGMTTFIQLFMLDRALFHPHTHCGVIAHNVEDAKNFFANKIRFAYDRLPAEIRDAVPATASSKQELRLANGSTFWVGTSVRSGTMQYLHISEFGKLCAKYPDKADEVVSGSLNTVHTGNFVFIESTAEGRHGHFYDMAAVAKNMKLAGSPLTAMDYKLHFYPWQGDPSYVLPGNVTLTEKDTDYFEHLRTLGIELTREQMNWYVKKASVQGDMMKQEYPSTFEEAFEKRLKGAVFGEQMSDARNDSRIGKFPHRRGNPVHTAWDLGHNDTTAIWFFQKNEGMIDFIDYHEHRLVDMTHYIEHLEERKSEMGYVYGVHHLPHDGASRRVDSLAGSAADIMRAHGHKTRVVERPKTKNLSIEAARRKLPTCRFDDKLCDLGLKRMEAYSWVWDAAHETYRKAPLHDWASNGADAFQTFAMGYRSPRERKIRLTDDVSGRYYRQSDSSARSSRMPKSSMV